MPFDSAVTITSAAGAFDKLGRAGNGKLYVRKHNKCGNVKILIDRAKRKMPFQSGNFHGIYVIHSSNNLLFIRNSHSAYRRPVHESADGVRFVRRLPGHW